MSLPHPPIIVLAAAVLITAPTTSTGVDNTDIIEESQRKLAEQCAAQPERCRDSPAKYPVEWKEYMSQIGSGTGFLVNKQGYALTNLHVIERCNAVTGKLAGKTRRSASLRATDPSNDLALLKLPGEFTQVAKFRESRQAFLGESILVAGFPLPQFLSQGLNISTGTISAVMGLHDDARLLQISAPIQPGNSGGPLLDKSAAVVGIVVGKLSDVAAIRSTGAIPQNVNFAIKGVLARAFLDIHAVDYATARSRSSLEVTQVAAMAQDFVIVVECWK